MEKPFFKRIKVHKFPESKISYFERIVCTVWVHFLWASYSENTGFQKIKLKKLFRFFILELYVSLWVFSCYCTMMYNRGCLSTSVYTYRGVRNIIILKRRAMNHCFFFLISAAIEFVQPLNKHHHFIYISFLEKLSSNCPEKYEYKLGKSVSHKLADWVIQCIWNV